MEVTIYSFKNANFTNNPRLQIAQGTYRSLWRVSEKLDKAIEELGVSVQRLSSYSEYDSIQQEEFEHIKAFFERWEEVFKGEKMVVFDESTLIAIAEKIVETAKRGIALQEQLYKEAKAHKVTLPEKEKNKYAQYDQ